MSSSTVVDPAAAEKLMQLTTGFMVSSALNAVARLRLADHLSIRPLTVTELAEKLQVNEDALDRVLQYLVSVGLFEFQSDRKYALNAVSRLLLESASPSMLDTILFLCDPTHLQLYADILPTIRDGRPAPEHLYGKGIFDLFAEDPAAQARFDNAMSDMSKRASAGVLAAYDFTGITSLVDVAGGHGLLLTSILKQYPQINGVLFDLPRVIDGAKVKIAESGLAERCKLVAGDFFESVPGGDAIILKHIIHDWEDSKATRILQNCQRALKPTNGKLLLVEMLRGDGPASGMAKVLDVEMLVLPGGKERTIEQYESLLNAAGFKLVKVVDTKSGHAVIEAACL